MSASRRALRSQDSRSSRHRQRPSYHEATTEDDSEASFDDESEHDEAPTRKSKRPTSSSSSNARDPIVNLRHTREQRRRTSTSRKARENLEAPTIPFEQRKRRRRAGTEKATTSRHSTTSPAKASAAKASHESSAPIIHGPIPPWAALPYSILLQIFGYASHPIYDTQTFRATPSATWLLQCSRICKSFAEPALTALYRCPPLAPMEYAHRLLAFIRAEGQDKLSFNYRAKLEAIHMEVQQTAMYSFSGQGHLDLHDLVYNLPRLQELELYHAKDFSPYRELDHSVKWHYSLQMFEALQKNVEGSATRLKSWRWNGRLMGPDIPIERMVEFHRQPYFSHLRKVAICNIQIAKLKKGQDDPLHELRLTEALSALPDLQHLVLESSTLINELSMPLLPRVEHLEIINCWEVSSQSLVQYLEKNGGGLRRLTLNHNMSLNFSFLTSLSRHCSKLENLSMDLLYHSIHQSYRNDRDPLYQRLLEEDERPTWPSTLRSISMLSVRKWDIQTAERFFQSLLDSAQSLPDLRQLVIQGIINIGWRERVSFRKKWEDAFDTVFLRRSTPPSPYLKTIRTYEAHIAAIATKTKPNVEIAKLESERRTPRHRDKRLRQSKQKPSYNEDSDSEDDSSSIASEPRTPPSQAVSYRASKSHALDRELQILHRTAGFDSPAPPSDNTARTAIYVDGTASDSDDIPLRQTHAASKKRSAVKQFIHGMVDVVDVKIDNLRPAETQFKESDFLDDEPEGDDDWDGTGDLEFEEAGASRRYAW